VLYINFDPIGVPYRKPDSESSHEYIDLKAEPEKIPLLPELEHWPEIRHLIPAIHATAYFKTIGVGAWPKRVSKESEFRSYLQFCFNDRAANEDAMNYYYIYHQFALFIERRTIPKELALSFVVARTDYNGGPPLIGWSAQVIIKGRGKSPLMARAVPNQGYELLVEFLSSQRPV